MSFLPYIPAQQTGGSLGGGVSPLDKQNLWRALMMGGLAGLANNRPSLHPQGALSPFFQGALGGLQYMDQLDEQDKKNKRADEALGLQKEQIGMQRDRDRRAEIDSAFDRDVRTSMLEMQKEAKDQGYMVPFVNREGDIQNVDMRSAQAIQDAQDRGYIHKDMWTTAMKKGPQSLDDAFKDWRAWVIMNNPHAAQDYIKKFTQMPPWAVTDDFGNVNMVNRMNAFPSAYQMPPGFPGAEQGMTMGPPSMTPPPVQPPVPQPQPQPVAPPQMNPQVPPGGVPAQMNPQVPPGAAPPVPPGQVMPQPRPVQPSVNPQGGQVMSGPMPRPGTVATIPNVAKTTKPGDETTKNLGDLMSVGQSIDNVIKAYNADPEKVKGWIGQVDNRWGGLMDMTPWGNEERAAFTAELESLYRMVYGFSGKQINENELERLQKFIPQATDGDAIFKAKAMKAREILGGIIRNQVQSLEGVGKMVPDNVKQWLASQDNPTNYQPNQRPQMTPDDEANDYLRRLGR